MEQEKTKKCTKCGRELPLSAFRNKKSAKDGLQSWCKECQDASTKKSVKKKKEVAAPAVVNETETKTDLCVYPDKVLMEELRRRGWKGTLCRTEEAAL